MSSDPARSYKLWHRAFLKERRSLFSACAITALSGLIGPSIFAAVFIGFVVGFGIRGNDPTDADANDQNFTKPMSILFVFVTSALFAPSATAQFVNDDRSSEALQHTALLATYRIHNGGTGTAFLIHHDGVSGIATAMTPFHCVDNSASPISLEAFDSKHWPRPNSSFSAQLVAFDENADIAIVQFDAGLKLLPTLRLRGSIPQLPVSCIATGCPRAAAPTAVPRNAVSLTALGDEIICDSSGIGGQSGSPLLYQGQVIGMHLRSNSTDRSWFASLDRMRALAGAVLPAAAPYQKPTIPLPSLAFVLLKLFGAVVIANRRWI